jgi:putative flippase GtrA
MGSRYQRLLAEAGRFLAVGGVATIVALFLFNLLVHGFNTGHHALLDDQPYLGYVIANTVGMMISYSGSRNWAFRDRPPTHADGGRAAYVGINVATMTLPIACLWISRNVLHLADPVSDNVSANVIGLLLGLGARFYLFRTFVFRRPIHLSDLYTPEQLSLHAADAEADAEGRIADSGPIGGLTAPSTDPSRSGRVPPPAP